MQACNVEFSCRVLCNAWLTALVAGAITMGVPAWAAQAEGGTVAASRPADADPAAHYFDVAAGPAAVALNEFAKQADITLVFSSDLVTGVRTNAVRGEYSIDEALQRMLSGSGLYYSRIGNGSVAISDKPPASVNSENPGTQAARAANDVSAGGDVSPASGVNTVQQDAQPQRQEKTGVTDLEAVVVTGTRIRGAQQASPLITITQDDMHLQGQTDLGQVVRALPQNFSGGQNPGISAGAGGINNQNISGSSSLNLRGLGQDATLTLLNGTRLPYDGFTQATDVAMIPIGAIDRMEVLLDGASAIYGSDAVGGVANIILKRDYNGAELSARWGEATEGGYLQHQYTAVAGTTWSTGGFIATADYNRNTGVEAGQRGYLSDLPPDTSIYAPSKQTGFLFSGHQQIGGNAELTVDAFYTKRKGTELVDFSALAGYDIIADRDTTIRGISPALRFTLPGEWSLKLGGAFGKNGTDLDQTAVTPGGITLFSGDVCYCNEAKSASVESEGPLFRLPGGQARLALGGGYRSNEFSDVNHTSGQTTLDGRESSRFVYGEIYLPFVSADQDIPLVRELSFSGAVRHENYDSFGSTTTPKVGVDWSLTESVEFKASWGKSFKVPTLVQQYQDSTLDLFSPVGLGGSGYPPSAGVLFMQGGNPNLKPERARTITAGFVIHPASMPGLHLETNWFDIDYTDRIVQPFNSPQLALIDPDTAEFVTYDPTIDQQNAAFALVGQPVGTFYQGTPPPPLGPYDPSNIIAIVDDRYVNSAAQRIHGIDLNGSYNTALWGGSFTINANATWLTTRQKLTMLAPEKVISGYVFFPPKYRWRVGGVWSRNSLTLSTTVNQTGGVKNNLLPGNVQGDAFTTVDFVADYVFRTGSFGHLDLNVGVLNLFNRRPPYMQQLLPVYVNYDSTNYSALGRILNVTLTERF